MTPSGATPFRCCRRGAIRSSVLGGVFAVTLAIGLFWLGTAGMSVRAQSNDGAEPSPLKARELPPDGVLQQLISFDPAGSYDHQCQLSDLGLADVSVGRRDPCIIEVTDSLDVFVDGFDHRLPIAYRITRPDGVAEEISVGGEPGFVGNLWVAIPGEPFGVYGVRATQRGRSVSGTFEVKPKTGPAVVFCTEHPFRCRRLFQPGVPIILYLAGYAPHSPTPLYVYRKVRDGEPGESPDCPITGCTIYEFASVGPAVVTDERGEAMVRLPTAAGDEGSYLLRSVPPIEPDWTARFAIGDPSP